MMMLAALSVSGACSSRSPIGTLSGVLVSEQCDRYRAYSADGAETLILCPTDPSSPDMPVTSGLIGGRSVPIYRSELDLRQGGKP